jgi:tetratricopeptide (TPR) repeat protein
MNRGLRVGLLVLGALFLLSLSPLPTKAQEFPPELDAIYKRGLEYYEAGKFSEAVPIAEEFIAVAKARFGEQHPLYAEGIGGLGVLYQALDRPSEAEPLLKRALSIKEIALGPDHTQVGDALYYLTEFYRKYNRLAEAEPLYTRARSIREKEVGAEYAVSTILSNLGELYLSQHRYVEAEQLLKRSLDVREKALGLEHHEVAEVLHKLNRLYQAIGRFDEARAVSIRSNEITEKVLGSEHKHLVDESTRNLAQLNLQVLELTRAGNYAKAVPLAERLIAAIEWLEKYGPNSVIYATALNNLASLYLDLSRFGEAEPLWLRSLAIREKAQGPDDPEVATSLNNLAELYRKLGRLSDAEPIYRRAIAIDERVGGPKSAVSLDNFGALLLAQARYAEAEQNLKRALAIRERTVGLRNPAVGATLNNLAQLYLAQRRFAEAGPLFKRSLAIAEDAFGSDHPDVGAVLNNLAWLAYGQRDWARAAAYWRRSTNIIKLHAERGVSFGRGEVTSREARQFAWHFEGLLQTTYHLSAQDLGPNPRATLGAEMFETAQWALGSEVASSLALMATRSTKGSAMLGGLVRERQDLVSEWQAKNRQLVAAKGEPWAKRKTDDERILADRISSIDARLAAGQKAQLGGAPRCLRSSPSRCS